MSRGEPIEEWLQRTQQEQAELRLALTNLMKDLKVRSIVVKTENAERLIESIKYAAKDLKIPVKVKYVKRESKVYFWTE